MIYLNFVSELKLESDSDEFLFFYNRLRVRFDSVGVVVSLIHFSGYSQIIYFTQNQSYHNPPNKFQSAQYSYKVCYNLQEKKYNPIFIDAVIAKCIEDILPSWTIDYLETLK